MAASGPGGRSPSASNRASTTLMLSGPPRSLASAISLSHAAGKSRSRVATTAISSFFTVPDRPSEHSTRMSPLRTSWWVRSTLTRASGPRAWRMMLRRPLLAASSSVSSPASTSPCLVDVSVVSCAAHPVGDDEQGAPLADLVGPHRGLERCLAARQIRDEEADFVVVARPAQVGLREDFDLDRLGGRAPKHGQVRHRAYRSP